MLKKKLDSYTEKLTKNEELIKKHMIKEDISLLNESISIFSKRIGTTPSAVTKYLDKIGLKGWKFFQTFLSTSITNKRYSDWGTVQKVKFFQGISAEYFKNNSRPKLKAIIEEKILTSEIVYVVGEGQTYYQAKYLAATLNKLGVTSMAISYNDATSPKLERSAILLSISGYNDYIMWFYNREKIKKTILISHFHHKSNKEIKTAIIGSEFLSNKQEKFLPLTSKLSMDIMIYDILRLVEDIIIKRNEKPGQ